jgi:hypothetical protein
VTAITTAGLLAGLFGSAFVPVARAASVATAEITASGGDGTDATYTYYSTAVAPTLSGVVTTVNAADDGVFDLSVSGGELTSATATLGGAAGATMVGTVVSTTKISTLLTASAAAQTVTFAVTLKKLTAGQVATVTVNDPDGDVIATISLQGRTAVTGVISATKSTLAKAAVGDVTTTASVEYIDASAKFVLNGKVNDANGSAITSAPVLLATIDAGAVTMGTGADAAAAALATGAAGTKAASATVTVNASGFYAVDVYHPGVDYAGGTYTVTVKNLVTGVVISTYTGGFIGAAATVTATPAGANVASGIAEHVGDFFTVVVKDAKGIEWHQAAASITVSGKDEAGTTTAGFTDAVLDSGIAIGAGTGIIKAGTASNLKYNYDKDICVAGKSGKTRTITFTSAAGITSNTKPSATVTLTCRADATATYKLSSLAFSKAQPLAGEIIDLTFGFVDADLTATSGSIAGYGAIVTAADYVVSLVGGIDVATTGSATAGNDIAGTGDGDINAAQTIQSGTGSFFVAVKSSTTVGTAMQATIPGSSLVATAATTDTSFSGTLTAGAKKLVATATFGLAAGGKKIAFTVENARTGAVKTYYRKANASGVATFTLRFRGTFEVTATFGDSITDTVTLRK